MNRDADPDLDPWLLNALERFTDAVDAPPADPARYAARIAERGGSHRFGPLLAILAGTAVALVFAFTQLGPGMTGEAPSASPQVAPTLTPAPSMFTSPSDATPTPNPAFARCEPVAPRELPNGDRPGPTREVEGELGRIWEWGSGDNAVRLAANHPAYSGSEFPPMFDAVVRGIPAALQTVGDSSLSQVTVTWMEGPCTYTIWIGPGLSVEEAREFASRY